MVLARRCRRALGRRCSIRRRRRRPHRIASARLIVCHIGRRSIPRTLRAPCHHQVVVGAPRTAPAAPGMRPSPCVPPASLVIPIIIIISIIITVAVSVAVAATRARRAPCPASATTSGTRRCCWRRWPASRPPTTRSSAHGCCCWTRPSAPHRHSTRLVRRRCGTAAVPGARCPVPDAAARRSCSATGRWPARRSSAGPPSAPLSRPPHRGQLCAAIAAAIAAAVHRLPAAGDRAPPRPVADAAAWRAEPSSCVSSYAVPSSASTLPSRRTSSTALPSSRTRARCLACPAGGCCSVRSSCCSCCIVGGRDGPRGALIGRRRAATPRACPAVASMAVMAMGGEYLCYRYEANVDIPLAPRSALRPTSTSPPPQQQPQQLPK